MPKGKARTRRYLWGTPETWAEVRRDYTGGMTAEACCVKHNVGIAGLRRRARLEGWGKTTPPSPHATRAAGARADPAPVHPHGVARGALTRASEALLDGRPAEAEAIIRALDVVLPVAELYGDDEKAAGEFMQMYEDDPVSFGALGRWAEHLAETLLGEREVPPAHAAWAEAWRARRAEAAGASGGALSAGQAG